MSRTFVAFLCVIAIAPMSGFAQGKQEKASLQLTLPGAFYAVPGVEMSIYFDNIVLTESPQAYRYDVQCELGEVESRRWTVTPTPDDVGTHPVSITITTAAGQPLAAGETTLHIAPANSGVGRDIRLLIVGDSLTHATLYPKEIDRLFKQPGNPHVQFLGTHRPSQAATGVAHEGYGGWTWQRFVSHYEPQPDGTHRKRSSPFVYLGEDGVAKLDVPRYFKQACHDQPPDFLVFMLGINDCFGAPPDDQDAMDSAIDHVLEEAQTLVDAFLSAAPSARCGICLTTPPNAREEAFQANYQDRYHRWGWKRIQHRLVQRELEAFDGKDRVFIIPTELNLDPIEGYPADNAVHPNGLGYRQIGASVYACLKAQLTAD